MCFVFFAMLLAVTGAKGADVSDAWNADKAKVIF
jgi:hypothetical protein